MQMPLLSTIISLSLAPLISDWAFEQESVALCERVGAKSCSAVCLSASSRWAPRQRQREGGGGGRRYGEIKISAEKAPRYIYSLKGENVL